MFESKSKNVSNKHSTNLSLLLLSIFVFIQILSFVSAAAAQSCSSDLNCPQGQICDNHVCRDCLTSAECLSKTFLKSTPLGGVSPWFSISMTVVMISLFGVGIFYMIAYFFQSEQYKRIAFAELMQVFASFLLIGFLFGFEIFETDLVTKMETTSGTITSILMQSQLGLGNLAYSGQANINPFDVSYAFLRKMIDCTKNQMSHEYVRSRTYSTLQTLYFGIVIELNKKKDLNAPIPNILAFSSSISQKAAEAEYNMNELMWLSLFLYAQIAVLKFIETSMFTLFLPIGIILRAFPPTRGAGAIMIAIAIGFYFVYPLVFTVLYVGSPQNVEGCNLSISADTSVTQKTCPANIGATQSIFAGAEEMTAQLDSSALKIQVGMSTMRYMAFVYMLISLGVTFIFVRSLSSILGADISEIGRTMFRML